MVVQMVDGLDAEMVETMVAGTVASLADVMVVPLVVLKVV